METSSTGMWVDHSTGEVVSSEPVEGRQLVAPGGIITPDVAASIERAKARGVQASSVGHDPSEGDATNAPEGNAAHPAAKATTSKDSAEAATVKGGETASDGEAEDARDDADGETATRARGGGRRTRSTK